MNNTKQLPPNSLYVMVSVIQNWMICARVTFWYILHSNRTIFLLQYFKLTVMIIAQYKISAGLILEFKKYDLLFITFEYNVLYLVGVRLDFVEQMTFLSNIQTVSVI